MKPERRTEILEMLRGVCEAADGAVLSLEFFNGVLDESMAVANTITAEEGAENLKDAEIMELDADLRAAMKRLNELFGVS